jgi:hypothetical protein
MLFSLTSKGRINNFIFTARAKDTPNDKILHFIFISKQNTPDASVYFANKIGQLPQSIRKDGRQIIKFVLRKLVLLAKI